MENTLALKSVILTGGNSGLGFECAKTIAGINKDWHIILACRNPDRGTKAVQALIEETSNKNVSFLSLDLASLESVRNFVTEYQAKNFPELHGLICNAGIVENDKISYTKDGFESTFGVNHLGHFLLTNLLLPHFTEPARIIVVSSNTHNSSVMDGKIVGKAVYLGAEKLAHPDTCHKLSGAQRYTTSKLCNLFFAYELDRRLKKEHRGITVNSFDPGASPGTNLGGGNSLRKVILGSWFGKSVLKMLRIVASTPQMSGAAMARLLLDANLENLSGNYYQINQPISSSEESYNPKVAKELWEDSIKLTMLG